MTVTTDRINWTPQPPVPTAGIMRITPDIAAAMLESNTLNRSLRRYHVDALAADMAAGRWHVSPDAIAFDTAGRLVNGQHRLSAIVKSGQAVDMLVMRNVAPGSYVVTDDGLKRTLGDQLRHLGHVNVNALAAVVALVSNWEVNGYPTQGGTSLDRAITKQMLIDRFLADPDGFSAATATGCRIGHNVGLSNSWWGTAMYVWTNVDSEDAACWAEMLVSSTGPDGAPLASQHPAVVLRDAIYRDIVQNRATLKHNRTMAIAYMVKAWNAFRAGEQIGLLRYRVGGAKPEQFPAVK
jgi:hypothetical protein